MPFFHYTTGRAMRSIIRDKLLKPHSLGDSRSLLWFSTNSAFERTVGTVVGLSDSYPAEFRARIFTPERIAWTRAVTQGFGHGEFVKPVFLNTPADLNRVHPEGIYRVVLPDLYPLQFWRDGVVEAQMRPNIIDWKESSGIRMGADPTQWYTTQLPVPMTAWASVDTYIDDRWIPVSLLADDTGLFVMKNDEWRGMPPMWAYVENIDKLLAERMAHVKLKDKSSRLTDAVRAFKFAMQFK